jgi:hypothetical protein
VELAARDVGAIRRALRGFFGRNSSGISARFGSVPQWARPLPIC